MITDAPLLLCDTSWAGKVCEQRETPRRAAVWRIQLCLAWFLVSYSTLAQRPSLQGVTTLGSYVRPAVSGRGQIVRINLGLTEAEFASRSRWMGRDNLIKRQHQAAQGSKRRDLKRARPTRNQAPSTLPKVDVHAILFAIILIVFVIHPLVQAALGR